MGIRLSVAAATFGVSLRTRHAADPGDLNPNKETAR